MYASTHQRCEVFVKVTLKKLLLSSREKKVCLCIVFDESKNLRNTLLLTKYYTT